MASRSRKGHEMTKNTATPTSTSRRRKGASGSGRPKKGLEAIDQAPAGIPSRTVAELPGAVRALGVVPELDGDGRPVALASSQGGFERLYRLEARKDGKFKTSSRGVRRWRAGELVGEFLTLHGLYYFAGTEGVEVIGQFSGHVDAARREHCARRDRRLECLVCGSKRKPEVAL